MEKKRITSFWLSLAAIACLALQDTSAQEQPGRSEPAPSALTRYDSSALATTQTWLPPLTPEELRSELASGTRALRARQWAKAALHFEHVLQTEAGHREAQRRLPQALKGLERLSAAARLESYYAEAIAAQARGDWRFSFIALRKVLELDPGHREANLMLPRAVRTLHRQLVAAHIPAVSSLLLDSLYAEGEKAIARADWLAALLTLEKIQILKPGFADVNALRTRAYQNLQAAQRSELAARPSFQLGFNVAKLAAVLFLLPFLGYLIISPGLHARLHFVRGNFGKAMHIYEKLIARDPRQVKYYGKLAQACLQLGRRDEFALKIYQIVLQLNLLNPSLRREINNIVAQYYLAEGRHDRDAIEVLEEALTYELHKQQNGGMALLKAGPNGLAVKNGF